MYLEKQKTCKILSHSVPVLGEFPAMKGVSHVLWRRELAVSLTLLVKDEE